MGASDRGIRVTLRAELEAVAAEVQHAERVAEQCREARDRLICESAGEVSGAEAARLAGISRQAVSKIRNR